MPDEIPIAKKSDFESTNPAAKQKDHALSVGRRELINLSALGLGISFFLPWANVLFGRLSGYDLQKMGAEHRLL